MSPAFEEILAAANRDPKQPDVGGLTDGFFRRCFNESLYGDAVKHLGETVAAEPTEAFEQLIGHGPEVAGALLEEFEALLAARGGTARRIGLERGALLHLVGDAFDKQLIPWRPEEIPPPNPRRRVVAYLPDDTDARLRLEAARRREGISQFVERAIEAELERIEPRSGEKMEVTA